MKNKNNIYTDDQYRKLADWLGFEQINCAGIFYVLQLGDFNFGSDESPEYDIFHSWLISDKGMLKIQDKFKDIGFPVSWSLQDVLRKDWIVQIGFREPFKIQGKGISKASAWLDTAMNFILIRSKSMINKINRIEAMKDEEKECLDRLKFLIADDFVFDLILKDIEVGDSSSFIRFRDNLKDEIFKIDGIHIKLEIDNGVYKTFE